MERSVNENMALSVVAHVLAVAGVIAGPAEWLANVLCGLATVMVRPLPWARARVDRSSPYGPARPTGPHARGRAHQFPPAPPGSCPGHSVDLVRVGDLRDELGVREPSPPSATATGIGRRFYAATTCADTGRAPGRRRLRTGSAPATGRTTPDGSAPSRTRRPGRCRSLGAARRCRCRPRTPVRLGTVR